MFDTKVKKEDIERAYKLLKTYYYYDNNMTLNTRTAIAKYECENILGNKNWAEQFKEKYFDSIEREHHIEEKIKEISVIHVIKSTIKNEKEKRFQILTNKSSVDFNIKYNYVIDAPIEIHILSMIWILKEGYLLDLEMSDNIYGSRLEINEKYKMNEKHNCIDIYKRNIFKLYHKQYSSWRDNALERVSNIVNKEEANAILINLDIKRYYYNIELEMLYKNVLNVNKELDTFLFSCIKKINNFYNKKIIELIGNNETEEAIKEKFGLPIGLLSSQVLANFYLKEFDDEILQLLPDYYGRYVDDILIVFKDIEDYKDKNIDLSKYIDKKLDRIISFEDKNTNKNILEIKKYKNLKIHDEKLKFYFFDKNSSNTLLEAFKEGIRENTSIFNFYTEEEEIDFVTEDSLISINYSGSKNKLSSIESFKNDKFKFSIRLSQLIMLYKEGNSNIKEKEKIAKIILKHFNGNIALENFLLWEKIFIFLLMNNLTEEIKTFYTSIKDTIDKKIESKKNKDIMNVLINSLLLAICFNYENSKKILKNLKIDKYEEIIKNLLKSNMYRHIYTSYGFVTYLRNIDKNNLEEEKVFSQNLFKFNLLNIVDKMELDMEKIKYSPRFIHFDEISIFLNLKNLNSLEQDFLEDIKRIFNNQLPKINQEKNEFPIKSIPEKIKIFEVFSKSKKENFNLGIVSIDFAEKDIEEKVLYNKEVKIEHIIKINKLLNEAIKNKVDILIFPEICIPEKLLIKLVNFSRRTGIAVIGGLQYIKNENKVYNTIITILPFEIGNYKSCFLKLRLKNYYSPGEEQLIKGYKYEIPINKKYYELFSWKGLYFTTFNCFELTSLSDRALFKNYIDLMIASVYNRDIKYFRNIVDSTARDLHCYVALVNVQKYGDSGVVVPKKSEMMTLSNIKGGINCNLLVTPIEIKSLREFQCRTIDYQSHDLQYKYTPPDIDEKLVKARIENNLVEYLKEKSLCKEENK